MFKMVEKIIIDECFDSEVYDEGYYNHISNACNHYLIERGIGPVILLTTFMCGT